MSKAQIAMTDLFLAILLLFILMTTFFVAWNIYQLRLSDAIPRNELEIYTIQFANQLIRSPGIPDNWEENQINIYSVDAFTVALLHLDETVTGPGVDNDIGLGQGTSGHHDECSANSDCGASAPVCCNVESHDGYVCEDPDHHSGTCEVGITPDSSLNENDGYLEPDFPGGNSPILNSISNCRINQCLEFDGTNDYVEIDHDSSLLDLTNFTIEFWIYPTEDQSSTEEHLIHKRNQWYIKIVDGMEPAVFIDGIGEFFPNYTFELGQWYHLALTNEHYMVGGTPTNDVMFYVNGEQVFSTTATGTPDDSTDSVFLGKQHTSANYFPGRIDELRISNTTRTQFNVAPDIGAIGLADIDRIISERKLDAFEDLGYEQIREISKIGSYEFYFLLLSGNESILELGNYPTGESVKLRRSVIYRNETATVEVSLWE